MCELAPHKNTKRIYKKTTRGRKEKDADKREHSPISSNNEDVCLARV